MLTFGWQFGLAYLCATLLASGLSHALRFKEFHDTVSGHMVIHNRFAKRTCLAVCVFELAAGCLALTLLAIDWPRIIITLFTVCWAASAGFVWYIGQLLSNPTAVNPCGCSPLAAPLTRFSLVPAMAMLLVSLMGLASRTFAPLEPGLARAVVTALTLLTGAICAGIVILLPATVPVALESTGSRP